MTLQLTTDGFWKTRGGQKVVIYAIANSARPAHGAVAEPDGWRVRSWFKDGRYSSSPGTQRELDIVGRWDDERPVAIWLWLYNNSYIHSESQAPSDQERRPRTDRTYVVGAVRLTGTLVEGKFE